MYVLQVNSGKELEVKRRLDELGIQTLVPEAFRYKRYKSSWNEEVSIIFTGYVFVRMDYSAENYYKIMTVDDIIRFLKVGNEMAALSFMEEEWIKILSSKEVRVAQQISINDEGEAILLSDTLKKFETRISKIDKHKRSAEFNLEVLNEEHKIVLGIDIV